jgi:hypothetical protein
MFNKELVRRVKSLEESDLQRRETPADYLHRKTEIIHSMSYSVGWGDYDPVKHYKGIDAYFYHNGKRYLITIKEDKQK